MRIAEVDAHPQGGGDLKVAGHFASLIPRQRWAQPGGQGARKARLSEAAIAQERWQGRATNAVLELGGLEPAASRDGQAVLVLSVQLVAGA